MFITYMPHDSFQESLKALTLDDLCQQVLDAERILLALTIDNTTEWEYNHPAVEMWRGYEEALFEYLLDAKEEANSRGIYVDTSKWNDAFQRYYIFSRPQIVWPDWAEDHILNKAHRQRLFLNNPDGYTDFSWDAIDPIILCHDECYTLWPSHIGE